MERAPDRYRYIFSQPFIAEPGVRWIYGAAATALIGRLIVKGTGQSLPDFARAALFDPIGVGLAERRVMTKAPCVRVARFLQVRQSLPGTL